MKNWLLNVLSIKKEPGTTRKLVRDKIPDIIVQNKGTAKLSWVDVDRTKSAEYETLLDEKINEEIEEFRCSLFDPNADGKYHEAADVLEVLVANILSVEPPGVTRERVIEIIIERVEKSYEARGGFSEGAVLESRRA